MHILCPANLIHSRNRIRKGGLHYDWGASRECDSQVHVLGRCMSVGVSKTIRVTHKRSTSVTKFHGIYAVFFFSYSPGAFLFRRYEILMAEVLLLLYRESNGIFIGCVRNVWNKLQRPVIKEIFFHVNVSNVAFFFFHIGRISNVKTLAVSETCD